MSDGYLFPAAVHHDLEFLRLFASAETAGISAEFKHKTRDVAARRQTVYRFEFKRGIMQVDHLAERVPCRVIGGRSGSLVFLPHRFGGRKRMVPVADRKQYRCVGTRSARYELVKRNIYVLQLGRADQSRRARDRRPP